MPLYVADYLADTAHLTGQESGAYLHLLMALWRSGGSLPDAPAKLARFCKLTPRQWASVEAAIRPFFVIADGRLSQARLTRELQKYELEVHSRATRASAGGKAKALKNNGPPPACSSLQAGLKQASSMLTQNQNSEPEGGLRPPAPAPTLESQPSLDVLAARIFDAGTEKHRERCRNDPRKIKWALRDAVARGEDPVKITAAVMAWITSGDQRKEGGRYAASPASFIDDNRWVNWVGCGPDAPASQDLALTETPVTEVIYEGRTYEVPPGGNPHKIGNYERPGIQVQFRIMDDWNPRRLSTWNEKKWGPPPGHPECRLWPSVLARFPHETWKDEARAA
jgi:uncharacterized protein YdaU (DUF1376 family)